MISRAMRKAVKGAGRGLKGKRNEQGDFIPLDEDTIFGDTNKGETSANFQEYVDNAKEEIDAITHEIHEVDPDDPDIFTKQRRLIDERAVVISELSHYLEINDIATPLEIRKMLEGVTGNHPDFYKEFGPDYE
jgi:hypothetical protein